MNVIKHARIALKHFAPGVALIAAVVFGPGPAASAQPVVTFTTTALPTTAASTGAEILNTGTLIAANHVGNGGQIAITLATAWLLASQPRTWLTVGVTTPGTVALRR